MCGSLRQTGRHGREGGESGDGDGAEKGSRESPRRGVSRNEFWRLFPEEQTARRSHRPVPHASALLQNGHPCLVIPRIIRLIRVSGVSFHQYIS